MSKHSSAPSLGLGQQRAWPAPGAPRAGGRSGPAPPSRRPSPRSYALAICPALPPERPRLGRRGRYGVREPTQRAVDRLHRRTVARQPSPLDCREVRNTQARSGGNLQRAAPRGAQLRGHERSCVDASHSATSGFARSTLIPVRGGASHAALARGRAVTKRVASRRYRHVHSPRARAQGLTGPLDPPEGYRRLHSRKRLQGRRRGRLTMGAPSWASRGWLDRRRSHGACAGHATAQRVGHDGRVLQPHAAPSASRPGRARRDDRRLGRRNSPTAASCSRWSPAPPTSSRLSRRCSPGPECSQA